MADPSETTQVSRAPADEDSEELLDAVRSLSEQVGGIQAELHALRAETRTLPPGEDRPGWDESAPVASAVREGPEWIRSIGAPRPGGLAVPWLVLEILFLVAVAILCVVADFDPPVIAGVMVAAWVLVAIGEWFAFRSARRQRALIYGAPVPVQTLPDDPSWLAVSSEETRADGSAEHTAALLPPPQPE